MKDMTIRLEKENDYKAVEELTREAFWNVYELGADEHYFVHEMRNHPDFIPELVPGALDGRKWMYIPSTAADCARTPMLSKHLTEPFRLKKRSGCRAKRNFIFTASPR